MLEKFHQISSQIAKRVWFWNSDEFPNDLFWKELEISYSNATIVGFNPVRRIEFESSNVGHGYFGVVNGNLFIHENRVISPYVTLNWILESIDFKKIILQAKKIIVIGPHTNSKDKIIKQFDVGLDHVEEWVIPVENHPAVKNQNNLPHYPTVYNSILERIRQFECANCLFLVAAGCFSKIYCEYIRKYNGCAIDIGSLFDKWHGFKTR